MRWVTYGERLGQNRSRVCVADKTYIGTVARVKDPRVEPEVGAKGLGRVGVHDKPLGELYHSEREHKPGHSMITKGEAYQVKDQSAVARPVADLAPGRSLHADLRSRVNLTSSTEAPLSGNNDEHRQNEAERAGEQRARGLEPVDGSAAVGVHRAAAVPERLKQTAATEDQESSEAKVGRSEDVQGRAALDGGVGLQTKTVAT